jgi:hypothetical protein
MRAVWKIWIFEKDFFELGTVEVLCLDSLFIS